MRPRARLRLLQRRRQRSECLLGGVEEDSLHLPTLSLSHLFQRGIRLVGWRGKVEVSERRRRRLAADFGVLNGGLWTAKEESTPDVPACQETILSLKIQVSQGVGRGPLSPSWLDRVFATVMLFRFKR